VAGRLENRPTPTRRRSQNRQAIVPGNAMPDPGIPEQEAGDVAANLYTVR